MLKQALTLIFLVTFVFTAALPVYGEVTRDDLTLLNLMFRNRFVPYAQQPDADPAVKAIAEQAGQAGSGDPVERYKLMTKGLAIMNLGRWDEAAEVATLLDMRVPAKLYEPGGRIEATILPVYEREGDLNGYYVAGVGLYDPAGAEVAKGAVVFGPTEGLTGASALVPSKVALEIPGNAPSGRYTAVYILGSEAGDLVLQGTRSIYVLENLGARLNRLEQKLAEINAKGIEKKSPRHALAAQTVAWFAAMYRRGMAEDVPGAYTGHPIFMTSIMAEAGMVIDRMDFTNELALAEELASALLEGKDPLFTRKGDMRLAYKSPADGELVPFRVYVPSSYNPANPAPMVMGLHGAGGDENSFMDRYQGLFKKNAERRGYIVVAANGRGPYGGYRGVSGQDPIDVINLVQEIYSIDKGRTYLMGHSMGGAGTITLGFDHAGRFAALAPIAGYGATTQLEKAPDMPLFIGQGDADALVPVERARAFHEAARKLGMRHVKYVERQTDHIQIVELVMDEVFDWFDLHAKGQKKG